MKTTITINDFINNEQLNNTFSYDGLVALFDYLEDFERDCGNELDFDPVALRCEFTEYNSIKDAYETYMPESKLADYATELEMMEYLQDNTQVIEFETGVILQDF